MHHTKFEDFEIADGSVDLVVCSPPYGIGKEYETGQSVSAYTNFAEMVVTRLAKAVRPGGMVCWQVGNYIMKDGSILPLDEIYSPAFRAHGFTLRNRIIWRVGHGLHATNKLSGRYEVLLCFAKIGAKPTFNLDEVRVPTKEPGKRSYKGHNRGELSGNPLGANPSDVWTILRSEWDAGVLDIPPVKNNHVEKTRHPCQFPVELAERCVLLYSNTEDLVFDPFAGTGTSLVAAAFHGRRGVGCDYTQDYCEIARERIELAKRGELPTRKIGTPIAVASEGTKTRQYPEEWKEKLEEAHQRKRLAKSPLQEYAEKVLKK